MTALSALLEELREVDFEAWKDIKFLLSNMMLWPEPNPQPLEQNAYADLVAGCIQRAIVAMGWSYIIEGCTATTLSYAAAVMWGKRTNQQNIRNADTPAAAILAAYIEAKRAMQ